MPWTTLVDAFSIASGGDVPDSRQMVVVESKDSADVQLDSFAKRSAFT